MAITLPLLLRNQLKESLLSQPALSYPLSLPEHLQKNRGNLLKRARMIRQIRTFFDAQAFTELDIPALTPMVSIELLAGCTEKFYALNGQEGTLQWYRNSSNDRQIMADIIGLLRGVAHLSSDNLFHNSTSTKNCDPFQDCLFLSLAEAFTLFCGIDLLATLPSPQKPAALHLASEAQRLGIQLTQAADWQNMCQQIIAGHIAPKLGAPQPAIIHDWPTAPHIQGQQDIKPSHYFQLYINGQQLATGFSWQEISGIHLNINMLAMLLTASNTVGDVCWLAT
ncbi:MAG: hypothetical protein ACOYK8_08610 [Alphaproteobacteria bacterium]